ncbi:DUF1653 domain-containing protein [Catenovulum sp. SM1970]|uniref:DUF1653 domain-containing protein n=1 Tax=Marinifaba aquimaris TaxID=2741323 RepID=UPI0015725AFD|nr:DUF1653 domain-containing protein [Marinifaba aquimaris]NTS77838.1 DUF1653 domain-containing protein [Marinifaba aquimaris]
MIKTGVYKHFKGNLYRVFGTAKHSENEQVHVVYKPLYGDEVNDETADWWIRPLAMFDETITRDGKTMKRFEWVGE